MNRLKNNNTLSRQPDTCPGRLAALSLAMCAAILSGCNPLLMNKRYEAAVHMASPERCGDCQTLAPPANARPVQAPNTRSADVWDVIATNLSLDFVDHPAVHRELRWFLENPDFLEKAQRNAERYLFFIVQRLQQENLPLDLALLPFIESAYNPNAYSRAHAVGLWQFIPETGRRFALNETYWLDDRRDVIKSTEAAIAYLKELNTRFNGDWLLTLAAYNAGEGAVSRAITDSKRKRRPSGFWQLRLPRETKAYVPKLIALSTLIRHTEQYRVILKPIANEPYFTSVAVHHAPLKTLALMCGTSVSEIKSLNPALKQPSTPPLENFELLLPTYALSKFKISADEARYNKAKYAPLVLEEEANRPDSKMIYWQDQLN